MSEGRRKLAAIMFTDIVGYTAITQLDESRALKLLITHNGMLRPVFEKHHGKEIKTIGDAFLIELKVPLTLLFARLKSSKYYTTITANLRGRKIAESGSAWECISGT